MFVVRTKTVKQSIVICLSTTSRISILSTYILGPSDFFLLAVQPTFILFESQTRLACHIHFIQTQS